MVLISSFLLSLATAQAWAASPICQRNMQLGVSAQINRYSTAKNEYVATSLTPPAPVAQVANTPCMSQELQRIGNQFAYAPTLYTNQLLGALNVAGGPISGIVGKFFQAEIGSINSAAGMLPSMLNFQSLASNALNSLLSSFGLSSAFSSALCGLMVDMLLSYVQCKMPIQLPSLGSLFGSLNDLLPSGCAGEALRSGLYAAGNMQSVRTMNQPITVTSGGTFVPGNAETLNTARGTPPPTTTP